MRRYVPKDYHRSMIEFAIRHPRCCLFAGVGVGKTGVSYYVADALLTCDYAHHVLVIAPKKVALNSWPSEREEWLDFHHLDVAIAVGDAPVRRAAIRRRAQITVINYDTLDWLAQELGDDWFFDMVIADEATRLKSLRPSVRVSKLGKEFSVVQGSKRARKVAKIAHSKVKRWINLTGSPAPNGLLDLYGMMWFVDAGRRLGRSYSAFEGRWFRRFRDPNNDDRQRIEPLPYAQEQIQAAIRDVCLTIEAKDFMDLPPLVESVNRIELPPKLMAMYHEFEEEMFMELAGHDVEAFNEASLTSKCLQFASGAIYKEDRTWTHLHDAKIDAMLDDIHEFNGEPILITYQFRHEIPRIQKALPGAVVIDDNPETVKRWNKGQIPYLLGHPAGMGHGLSLQHGGRVLIDFSSGWDLELDEQVIGRIGPTRQAQSGYNRTVYRRRLVAKDTIEEYVVRRLRTKAKVQDILREAMKCRT